MEKVANRDAVAYGNVVVTNDTFKRQPKPSTELNVPVS